MNKLVICTLAWSLMYFDISSICPIVRTYISSTWETWNQNYLNLRKARDICIGSIFRSLHVSIRQHSYIA